MDAFEVLWEYSNHAEADLAKGMLESNGIPAFDRSDDCGGMAGGQTFVWGVKLLVNKEDVASAKEILQLK